MQGRKFGGWDSPTYYYNGFFQYKKDAVAKANQLRKTGNLARVVAVKSGGYEVWDRRK